MGGRVGARTSCEWYNAGKRLLRQEQKPFLDDTEQKAYRKVERTRLRSISRATTPCSEQRNRSRRLGGKAGEARGQPRTDPSCLLPCSVSAVLPRSLLFCLDRKQEQSQHRTSRAITLVPPPSRPPTYPFPCPGLDDHLDEVLDVLGSDSDRPPPCLRQLRRGRAHSRTSFAGPPSDADHDDAATDLAGLVGMACSASATYIVERQRECGCHGGSGNCNGDCNGDLQWCSVIVNLFE